MRDLAQRLNIPLAYAIGLMEKFWHWANEQCKDGGVGVHSNLELAIFAGFEPLRADEFVEVLVCLGLLDPVDDPMVRLAIHDWPEHCWEATRMWLARHGKLFADGSVPSTARCSQKDKEKALQLPQYANRAKPQKPKVPSFEHARWPLTEQAVRGFYAACGDELLGQLVQNSRAAVVEAGVPIDKLTDSALASAVSLAHGGNRQRTAALFLTTVPNVLKTWAVMANSENGAKK